MLPEAARALCDAMGWEHTLGRSGEGIPYGGAIAVEVLAELSAAGWSLVQAPTDETRVLCEWIDRTLSLPMYQAVARDSYAEGVVETLRTVRKLVSHPTEPESEQ